MKKNICYSWIMLFCIMLHAGIKSESAFDLLYAVDDSMINCSNFYGKIYKNFSKINLFLELGTCLISAENLSVVTPEVDLFLDSGSVFAGNINLGIESRKQTFLQQMTLQVGVFGSENCDGSLFLMKLKPGFSLVEIGCDFAFRRSFGIQADFIAGNFGAKDFFSKKIINGDNWNILILLKKDFLFGENILSVKTGILTGECNAEGSVRVIDTVFYREKYGFTGLETHTLILSELGYKRFCRIGMISFGVKLLYVPQLEGDLSYHIEKRFLGKDDYQSGMVKINFNNSFVCLPEVGFEKDISGNGGNITVMLKKTACLPFEKSFLVSFNEREIAALLLSGFTVGVKLSID